MDLVPNVCVGGGGALPSKAPGGTGMWVTQRLSGDSAAGVLWRRGGDSLILKLMTEKRAEDRHGCFYASDCSRFCAIIPGKFWYF